MQAPPEQLGSFYLGARYDLKTGERSDEPINYDARNLTTHAVCVGMTGSGKTGLCIGLLEEAALDKVPAILIDPKGDMVNLLLQFPEMQPGDFEPWINADDAARKGQSVEEYAGSIAETWRSGLGEWGIDPADRIQRLMETTKYTVFTPGSDAGLPINILGSLAAPQLDFESEAEAIRERISGTVAALLGLLDINADPMQSREAILLANIFEHYWKQKEDLDLAKLITALQEPPLRQIGVFDVDTFFPQKDRFALAMSFNNLMAAPSFQGWLQGEPLDVETLFYTDDGQPRHSIFYIAHLSERERMFFVTLLLENLITWMRRQSGTTSLRALLYFDEVFGFFPPVAEPPSKRPLLTLLKQARAYGVGCILVTQNPVDIDYKGLTNAGTWLIGKLQAERDKARVLQGLEGAIAEAGNRAMSEEPMDYDQAISQLDSRVFLMHNVHEDEPVVFHTRWAQSYLRGPLTRPQVKQLVKERPTAPVSSAGDSEQPVQVGATPAGDLGIPQPRAAPSSDAVAASPRPTENRKRKTENEKQPTAPPGFSATPPALDPSVEQVYLPLAMGEREAVRYLMQEVGQIEARAVQLLYEPAVVTASTVRFLDRKREIDEQEALILLTEPPRGLGGVDWEDVERLPLDVRDLLKQPERVHVDQGPFFAPPPREANSSSKLKSIEKDLSDWLYYNKRLPIRVHEELEVHEEPGEPERAFQRRLQEAARERRDAEVDKLEESYETKIERVQERLRKKQHDLAEDEMELKSRRNEELIGIGESVLGYFVGRKTTRGLSRAATKRRMTNKARMDIEEAEAEIKDLEEDKEELETELKEQSDDITKRWADALADTAIEELKPRRADVDVRLVALAWKPAWHIRYDDRGRSLAATIPAHPLPPAQGESKGDGR